VKQHGRKLAKQRILKSGGTLSVRKLPTVPFPPSLALRRLMLSKKLIRRTAIERPMLIVQVWLGATDADIMAAFERELSDARKKHPSALKKRGPTATTGRFGKAEFDRWQTQKIVEISELSEWAAREGVTVKNADLGRWLFAGYADPDKAAYDARQALRQAIGSIRALWAQVHAGTQTGVTDNQAELP
jgi:hypothetical protein